MELASRSTGVPWEYVTEGDNSFYSTKLVYRDKTDLIFANMLPAPSDGSVCVQFKYQKYSLGKNEE